MGSNSPVCGATPADDSRRFFRRSSTSPNKRTRSIKVWTFVALTIAALVAAVGTPGLVGNGPTVSAAAQDQVGLTSSEPANGSVLDAAPTSITLTFDKEVPLGAEDTAGLTCAGDIVVLDDGELNNDRTVLTYAITGAVPSGFCDLKWALADGATRLGGGDITFNVGVATPASTTTTTTTAAPDAAATASTTTQPNAAATPAPTATTAEAQTGFAPMLWFSRFLSTTCILVLFGALVVIATGWPEGPEYYVTTRFLQIAWAVSLVATFVYIISYAAQVRGASLSAGLSPAAWLDLSQDGWSGMGAVARLVAVAASGYVAMRPERLDDPNTGLWAWILPAIAVVTVALSRVSPPAALIGVVIGVAHAFGSAVWFGGAAFVGRVVLAGPGEEDLVVATRAYSRTSLLAILVTIVTGVMQTIRLDASDLLGSHGRIVLFKVLAVGVMLFIGLEARKQVRFRLDREYEMSPNNAARFRRAYGTETVFGIVALALSSLLVSISPGSELPWAGETYAIEGIRFDDTNSGIEALLSIGPLQVGNNGYLLQVSEPAVGISELKLRFIPPPGTANGQAWIVEDTIPLRGRGDVWRPTTVGIPFGVPGEWRIQMTSTTQQDSQSTIEVAVTVTAAGAASPVVSSPGASGSSAPASESTTTTRPASVSVVPASTTAAPEATNPP